MLQKVTDRISPFKLAKETIDAYMAQLQELRPWWPVLIPFLIWQAKKAYDREYQETIGKPGKPVARQGSG